MLKILIDSLFDNDRIQTNKVLHFYDLSDQPRYLLTQNPENADLILICDVIFDDYGDKLKENKYIKRYPDKCFILSNKDRPLPLFRGILTCGEKSFYNFGRIRSSSYIGHSDAFKNPFITPGDSSFQKKIPKSFLFSFIGRNCHAVRNDILTMSYSRDDIHVENSDSTFDLYVKTKSFEERQKRFFEIMSQSKFVLCPRGWGATSYRLFETMSLGIAPVIIADDWILPQGPDWASFSVIIKEKDVKDFESRLINKENDCEQMGRLAREAYEKYFDDKFIFDYVISNCLDIQKRQWIPESFFQLMNPTYIRYVKFKTKRLDAIRRKVNKLFGAWELKRNY